MMVAELIYQYINEDGSRENSRLLNKEEEYELLGRYQDNGDQEALRLLIKHNIGLVHTIARKYEAHGVDHDDLLQHGYIGLLRACKRFKRESGNRFSTYATWWIRHEVSRAVADYGRTIRLPVHRNDEIYRMRMVSAELAQKLGREPTSGEIAEAMRISVEKVRKLKQWSRRVVSLEQPIGNKDDSDASVLGNFIPDDSEPIADLVALRVDTSMIARAIWEVTGQDPDIPKHPACRYLDYRLMMMRFGMLPECTAPMTLEEIARKFGVTRERIRQREGEVVGAIREWWHWRSRRNGSLAETSNVA